MTGNFDNWSQSLPPLAISEDGATLSTQIRVPERQKLVFKFVVDDANWVLSAEYPQEHDENGIANNYIAAADLVEVQPFEEEPLAVADETKKADVNAENAGLGAEKADSGVDNSAFEVQKLEHVPKVPETAKETPSLPSIQPLSGHKEAKNDGSPAYDILTQVSTADSSYAALSIPGSSDFEHVPRAPQENAPVSAYEEEDFNTPTNSLFNLTVLSGNQNSATNPSAAFQKGSETSTANTSFNSEVKKGVTSSAESQDTVKTLPETPVEPVLPLKLPGSFPSPDRKIPGSSRTPPSSSNVGSGSSVGGDGVQSVGKKDNLISRFKGLFRY